MNCTLDLGTNIVKNSDAALVINGEEVFRLRERDGDGQLCVDFDLRAPGGKRIAKVAKNNFVYGADKYSIRALPKSSELIETATGKLVAKVEEMGHHTLKIVGEFNVGKTRVVIEGHQMTRNGVTIAGNIWNGGGTAYSFDENSIAIGGRAKPKAKLGPNAP